MPKAISNILALMKEIVQVIIHFTTFLALNCATLQKRMVLNISKCSKIDLHDLNATFKATRKLKQFLRTNDLILGYRYSHQELICVADLYEKGSTDVSLVGLLQQNPVYWDLN